MGRIFVALGGNALQKAGGAGTWAEAVEQMRATAVTLTRVVRDGNELLLTHGNGPQVGALLRQNEVAARQVPPRPMHVLGAETEGQVGYLIQQELGRALSEARLKRAIVPLICRIKVSRRDPAFQNPTKPVGSYYSEDEARLLRKREGWHMAYDGARGGWRRVVPSPKPVAWVEEEVLRFLMSQGWGAHVIPVLAGGGGVPVVTSPKGGLVGVDAVIDKDLVAGLLAGNVRADTLAIVTDVPGVAIGFRRPWERWLGEVTADELGQHLQAGEFAEGSMRPKVEAALSFLAQGGRRALITDAPSLPRALRGEAGTRVLAR
jgi:carbamate kinase